ncbi:hypothetical protein [Burkholderia phage FLC9]|nr:hypothetical protein [Burkholderia phage FLC9]
MDVSIKGVFESECADLAIDAQLAKRLHLYTVGFAHKNQDHIEFFGGNLTGVQVVRFTDADRDQWFHEILKADEGALEERLLALPTVNADFNVSSDTMNLSCAWLMHALLISKKLSDHQRHEAMMDVALVLQYKFLTSRLYRHFKYPADRATAEATYAQLTYKYAIKQYGSWAAVLNARAEEIISPTGLHHNAVETMNPDSSVVYLLNDTQGRIRDMLKNIYDVFLQVHRQGIKISSTSSMVEHDGVEILKDKSKNLLAYTRYINSIITDRNSFIREELVTVIEKQMKTMPPRLFRESLEWMSDNYRQAGASMIEELLNETLIHSFDYLAENRSLVRNSTDLASLLTRLRGVYMSSRSTDPALFSLREKAEKIVKLATQNKNTSVIASVRTGLLLYLIARAYSMRYYAQSAVGYPTKIAA